MIPLFLFATALVFFWLGRLSRDWTFARRSEKYNAAIRALGEGWTPLLKRVAGALAESVQSKRFFALSGSSIGFGDLSDALDWEVKKANALLRPIGMRMYVQAAGEGCTYLGSGDPVPVGEVSLYIELGKDGKAIVRRLFTENADSPLMMTQSGPGSNLLRPTDVPAS